MKTKVLMLLHNLRVSAGVSSYVMNYYRSVNHNRIQMDFVIWKDVPSPYYKTIEEFGSRVYVLPSLKNLHQHIKMCEQIIKDGHYDIIHDNTLLISYPIMRIAKKHNVPVRILHSHNSKLGETPIKEIRNSLFLPLLKATATDFAACSGLAAEAMNTTDKYTLIPNVILDDNFAYSTDKRTITRRKMRVEDKIVIGSVGRVAEQKNPLFALDVIRELIKGNESVEYWWIGSGPMDQEFKNKIEELGLEKHVKALGSREDVADLYQAMDLFFMPSRFEGFGIVAVEAQTMGLPTVASSVLPQEIVFTDDLVTFVDLNESIEKWAIIINNQLQRSDERKSRIPELQRSLFSCKNAGKRLEKLYLGLLLSKSE